MDIVIPVKAAILNEELRYTLRSICANFPHNKIWIVGYLPPWLNGDINFIPGNTAVGNKYPKVLSNHLATMRHDAISEDFYLFNDDFFILKPIKKFENFYRCTIDDSVKRLLKHTNGVESTYLRSLVTTKEILEKMGVKNLKDYGLHIPMTINRKKWLQAWEAQKRYNLANDIIHMRTIYGNIYKVADKQMDDVKILTMEDKPKANWKYASTVDSSFIAGAAGEYIRDKFKETCKCEHGI